jgi:ABC-type multidrug transport system fused ATPase/permease subunit
MITIAHRLNTIINSDRVLVLSYGQILEYDKPKNLMNDKTSEFSKLLQEVEKKAEKKEDKKED